MPLSAEQVDRLREELAEDRMALWREVSAADWLTADEKKALLGMG